MSLVLPVCARCQRHTERYSEDLLDGGLLRRARCHGVEATRFIPTAGDPVEYTYDGYSSDENDVDTPWDKAFRETAPFFEYIKGVLVPVGRAPFTRGEQLRMLSEFERSRGWYPVTAKARPTVVIANREALSDFLERRIASGEIPKREVNVATLHLGGMRLVDAGRHLQVANPYQAWRSFTARATSWLEAVFVSVNTGIRH